MSQVGNKPHASNKKKSQECSKKHHVDSSVIDLEDDGSSTGGRAVWPGDYNSTMEGLNCYEALNG
jgi:hypothetical protein